MTRLSHADAHERLADVALEPRLLERLAGLAGAASPEAGQQPEDPLTAHLRACAPCRRDLAAWLQTHRAVVDALGAAGDEIRLAELIDEAPIVAPESLRAAVQRIPLGNATSEPVRVGEPAGEPAGELVAQLVGQVAGEPAPASLGRRPNGRLGGLSGGRLAQLVAVLATVVLVSGLLVDRVVTIDHARTQTAELEAMTATLDRVIRDPAHRVVDLRGADGAAGGSVSWTSRDLVVLTTALAEPPGALTYRCWIEAGGRRSPIGVMFFVGGTGYWTGSADAWAATSFGYGATFGISLEPAAGGTGGAAVLSADLGG